VDVGLSDVCSDFAAMQIAFCYQVTDLKLPVRLYLQSSKVYVDLYSAFLCKAPQMRSEMDHTVLPANYTMPAFTPQPQNITALWLVLILPSHGG